MSEAAAVARPWRWRGPRFIAEVFDGADEALAALESVQRGLVCTGFQSIDWLTVLYEDLAPAKNAMPRLVVVTERNSGNVALILPLIIYKKRALRIARFADLGVSDYGGPILGPAVLKKRRSIRRAWRAVRRALKDVDMIRLERMPAQIGGRANPLVTRSGVAPARHNGNVLTIDTTVDDFLRERGKKYRKEVERCTRLWKKEGEARFDRAMSAQDIARAYVVLEEQQLARHAALGSKYILNQPAYRAFYERLVMDGAECGLGYLFTLKARGAIVAALFGIVHDGTFTLLRISNGGDSWSHLSPGRLVIVEAMRYFVAQGVRRFDFGIGDYPFKRGFGVGEVPLYDLIVAKDLSALPKTLYHRAVAHARKNPAIRNFVRRLKARAGRA
ncbi:MAG TPA: GNAT family N-acetyltransferase [Hyphomicrobium sp.]|nr:GNAT family N-acetyltransferase [Hyphomicrobium sp.]